jgi:cytochrome c
MRSRVILSAIVLLAVEAPSTSFAQAGLKGDVVKGSALFKSRCAVCHSVDAAKPKATAPTLAGVVDRKAGSLPKARYSSGMKAAATVVWTPSNLDKYLTSPRDVIKGTYMVIKLTKPQDRADVIAYLGTLRGKPEK